MAVKIIKSLYEKSFRLEEEIYNTTLLRHPNILGYYGSDVVSVLFVD